ncbi:MAG: type II secretion system F family protein [Clostridia bacterium]|nr:type II secretion system F family protein [Clostridia bacterium]
MKKVRLSNDDIGALCLSLSMMLHAGVGPADGLSLMAEDEEGPMKELLKDMAAEADMGLPLNQVFKDTESFPDYVCSLLTVGEESGRTEEALNALSNHYETQAAINQRLRTALLYPAILLLIMLAVIVVLLVYVLPIFNEVYTQLGASLSGVAGGLLSLGQALGKFMPVLCVLLGIIVALVIAFAASPSFREKILTWYRGKFGDKGISGQLNMARFAGALSMGISSGLTPEDAISLSTSILEGIPTAQARCKDCLEKIFNGANLSTAMNEAGLLPKAECRLLETGIRAGAGDTAMEQVARRLAESSEYAVEAKVGQVEPAMVIVCSVLVGLILLAVMMPLMHIMAVIG